jgi:Methylamine utilisation protein MauE
VDPLIQLTMAWGLALLFASSTLHKLWALSEWPGVVRNYRLLPDALGGVAAAVLLCAGALTAGALCFGATRRVGAFAAALQLLIFGAALWVNLHRGRTRIDCGCFGSRLRLRVAPWMVARNAVLALLALTLLLPVGARELSIVEGVFAAACVLTLAFLYPVIEVVLVTR